MTSATQADQRPAKNELSHLRALEAEAIHIICEGAAVLKRPALLFSGGKDSVVMCTWPPKLRARPRSIPGDARGYRRNFEEVPPFATRLVAQHGVAVGGGSAFKRISTPDGRSRIGPATQMAMLQTVALLRGILRTSSMAYSAARVVMRRRRAPRSGSSASATNSGNGIQKSAARSCGTCTTAVIGRARISGCSRCPTGRNTEYVVGLHGAEEIELPASITRTSATYRARRDAAGRGQRYRDARKGTVTIEATVRFRTSATRRARDASSRRPPPQRKVMAEIVGARVTERAEPPVPTIGFPRREWKTASEGYF